MSGLFTLLKVESGAGREGPSISRMVGTDKVAWNNNDKKK